MFINPFSVCHTDAKIAVTCLLNGQEGAQIVKNGAPISLTFNSINSIF